MKDIIGNIERRENELGNLILECKDLHKSFGKKEILKGVSVQVEEGDILGFIGPNGARKDNNDKVNFRVTKY